MTRRLLTGLAGLLVLALALVGLPAFLLAVQHQLADLMPALSDLPGALLAPGDGGLFLLTLLGMGWACWAVFLLAFLIEVTSRVRGIRTPRLGPFLPQRTAAWAITAVTMLASLTGTGNGGSPATTSPTAASASATTQTTSASTLRPPAGKQLRPSTAAPAAHVSDAHPAADSEGVRWRDYRVKRGDTLWDIADHQLGNPTAWPSIASASDQIRQPDGRRLDDPDLILPGWNLHIPNEGSGSDQPATQSEMHASGREHADDPIPRTNQSEPAPLPTTPLHPPAPTGGPDPRDSGSSCMPEVPPTSPGSGHDERATTSREPQSVRAKGAAALVPSTRQHPSATSGSTVAASHADAALQLPAWVREPLISARFEDAPTDTRAQVLAALAVARGLPPKS